MQVESRTAIFFNLLGHVGCLTTGHLKNTCALKSTTEAGFLRVLNWIRLTAKFDTALCCFKLRLSDWTVRSSAKNQDLGPELLSCTSSEVCFWWSPMPTEVSCLGKDRHPLYLLCSAQSTGTEETTFVILRGSGEWYLEPSCPRAE